MIKGHPAHVEHILKGLRRKYGEIIPTYDGIPEEARKYPDPLERPWMTTRVTLDLNTAERQAAKIALGAGTYIWPASFPSCDLARQIRERLWSSEFVAERDRMECRALDVLWRFLQEQLPIAILPDW